MAEDTATIAASIGASVTGPGTPDNVQVRRPTREAVWAMFATLGTVSIVGMTVVSILAWMHWPESTASQRIFYIGWMGFIAQGCVPIIVIAMSSSRLGKVEASAGANHLTVEGRQ